MSYQFIQYELSDRIIYLTLNRPDKRNALNYEIIAELRQAFTQAEKDNQAKVIILKSNGKVFSAGADLAYLKTLQNNTYQENLDDSTNLMELFKQIYTLDKIVIAQIEGHAIAGGCGLASICDFSFAVPEASFGFTEVKIGFVPAIVMVFLIRKIGEAKTKELFLSGELINANSAKDVGIVNFVIAIGKIEKEVKRFAHTLCNNVSGESVKLTKKMFATVQDKQFNDALTYAAEMNAQARQTEDCKKGIACFLEKQKINW